METTTKRGPGRPRRLANTKRGLGLPAIRAAAGVTVNDIALAHKMSPDTIRVFELEPSRVRQSTRDVLQPVYDQMRADIIAMADALRAAG